MKGPQGCGSLHDRENFDLPSWVEDDENIDELNESLDYEAANFDNSSNILQDNQIIISCNSFENLDESSSHGQVFTQLDSSGDNAVHNEVEVEHMQVFEQSAQETNDLSSCLMKTNRGRPIGKLSDYIKEVKACGQDKRQKKIKKNNVSSFLYRERKKQTVEKLKKTLEKMTRRNVQLQQKYKKNKKNVIVLQEILKQIK